MVLLFLGEGMKYHHFAPPRPISHARWMAKGIYCLKMFLHREYLGLTKNEFDGIRDVSIYVCTSLHFM